MLTVKHDLSSVESDLFAGRLCCPGCGGVLRPWGWARRRLIRHGTGSGRRVIVHRPRRGRCTGCAATHVLLGLELAARRADTAAVIAAAIEAKTLTGAGHRGIAVALDRPASTVRGWLRAFGSAAGQIGKAFTAWTHRDGPDSAALWPKPESRPAGQALAAVMAYAAVLAGRLGIVTLTWHTAGLMTAGRWFFSSTGWPITSQHELALTPEAG